MKNTKDMQSGCCRLLSLLQWTRESTNAAARQTLQPTTAATRRFRLLNSAHLLQVTGSSYHKLTDNLSGINKRIIRKLNKSKIEQFFRAQERKCETNLSQRRQKKITLRTSKATSALHALKEVGANCVALISGALKILWTHYQIIGTIEIIRIDWPDLVLSAANLLGVFMMDAHSLFGVGCYGSEAPKPMR